MKKHHFLIISLPAQGHINPTLQLAKNLARAGARCTFVTTVHGFRKMNNLPSIDGLFYASISDGHDDGKPKEMYFGDYLNDLKRVGSENLKNLLQKFTDDGYPVTCLVYTILFTWVAEVAREYHAPSAFLAIQCAAAFAIYYHLFTTNNGIYSSTTEIEPSFPIKLPESPLFSRDDIPTFLLQSDSASSFMIPVMREHIKILENDPNPRVLINTFDALEEKSLKIFEKIGVSSIGPLIPSAFCDGNDVNDKSFGCELFDKSENYSQWLDSKAEGSVVYISFGSLAVLKEEQKEEILKGLLESERPFLWVIRTSNKDDKIKNENYGLNGKGMIVPWCSQMEVLFHKSIGCFMSHCGWNSTLESIAAGVPLIGYPQFSDQVTNIKMVEEVWGTGVRARPEEGIVKREELKRCLEILMGGGEKGNEIRRNVKKYGDLAMEAVKEGGSSHYNLNKFIDSL
ncbi:PREDICTED: crocetin glucosyltransferase, chloroplastic-like isoform X1 [Nicotiana attenuata]|uniref:Glycosyltransferase n=1 Tax=Nicotiana attenuata TaxID=49451 RepID=A0A2I2MNC6_NICAT|nr:PREDICTED: crocetin glucosyltransferase, chloroplastic-like isoform X1 [Nicotiana attenuata]AQQ16633.1 UDP-glycosyltransferase g04160 [Nicotiana attenuata]OIT38227.1 udp-glycosyltransferase 75c1 [Nicotiana attenuata]